MAYHVALVVLLLAVGAVTGLRRSGFGRALIAARDNEATAAAMGVDLTRLRLTAFAISGGLAAAGGVLFTYQQGGVRPDAFAPELSILVFVVAVIGGFGSPAAPLAGFVAYATLSLVAGGGTAVSLVTGGLGLALVVAQPGGLAAVGVGVRDGYLRRVARRRRIAVPTLDGTQAAIDRAPLRPKVGSAGNTEFVPRRYGLEGQWLVADGEHARDEREVTGV